MEIAHDGGIHTGRGKYASKQERTKNPIDAAREGRSQIKGATGDTEGDRAQERRWGDGGRHHRYKQGTAA